jgi:hypothetical protein
MLPCQHRLINLHATPGVCPAIPLCLQQKRAASFKTRTVSTVSMIAGFLVIIYMGHVPLVLLVLTLQVGVALQELSTYTDVCCWTGTSAPLL